MLHSGSNFEIRDNAGRTPLHFALWHRYSDEIPLEFIGEILKRDVNTNARDIKGRSGIFAPRYSQFSNRLPCQYFIMLLSIIANSDGSINLEFKQLTFLYVLAPI